LLFHLKERKGDWVSGESLSNQMAVSRSAVWKQISKLREEGYGIDSSPKKGYILLEISKRLLPNEIREGLDTVVFGQKDIVYFEETDSTNTRAMDLASKGAPEGTLIVSEMQKGGRGRKGRKWFSPPWDGIYLSLILRPHIPPSEAPKITLLMGVAAAETILMLTSLKADIKWPNDILVNGKKLAGILTEIHTEMDAVDYVVVGLGMNVNTRRFPHDIKEKATSLFIETGSAYPRAVLIREYLKRSEKYYELLKRDGFAPIRERWKALAGMIGHRVMVEMIGKTFVGTAHDIDDTGFLILKDPRGRTYNIFSGDVTLM
ncbi:MAG: biotin--[acetyl-CoA-carboxylase] ligase, partial [Pseudomonadota bacterium]